MPRSRRALALLVCSLALPACSTFARFHPVPLDQIPFEERSQSQTVSGVTVRAAVLSRDEARRAFGVDLESRGIQPVWIRLENATEIPYALLLTGVDPSYFSAHEAAYQSHLFLRPFTNARIDRHFDSRALDPFLPPLGDTEGFVFSNLKLGTKEVRIRLFGPARLVEYSFYIPVPGFKADYHAVDWEAIEAQGFVDYRDEDAFREALRALPCCTTRPDGSGRGDPVNLVVIGSGAEVGNALVRAGWDETERLTLASALRTVRAFFGGAYRYSPMSSLYLFGRGQDAGFQKARDTIHQRNHLRLWLSNMTFRGRLVWVGTISRDIGVYFTPRTWNLTTHAIDPYVDEARTYLREDFTLSLDLVRFGFAEGVGAASEDEPRRNLMLAPWWSDGLRLVMELAPEGTLVPVDRVGFFFWDWPGDEGEQFNEMLRRLAP